MSGQPPTDDQDLPEQLRIRREKRAELLASGQPPYRLGFPRSHTFDALRAAYPDLPPAPKPATAPPSRAG